MSLHPPTVPHVPAKPNPTTAPAVSPGNGEPPAPVMSQTLTERLHALDEPAERTLGEPAHEPRRRKLWLYAAAAVIIAAALSAVLYFTVLSDPFRDLNLEFIPVSRGKVSFTVLQKGELEAVRNTDVICKVRSKSSNSPASKITTVVDNGTEVKKGDIVVELEASALKAERDTQEIKVKEKIALLIEAEKELEKFTGIKISREKQKIKRDAESKEEEVNVVTLMAFGERVIWRPEKDTPLWLQDPKIPDSESDRIVKEMIVRIEEAGDLAEDLKQKKLNDIPDSQNKSALQTAFNSLKIAELDFRGQIELDLADFRQADLKLNWANRMVKPGYLSPPQARVERNKRESARFKLEKDKTDLGNKMGQARVAWKLAEIEAIGNAAKAIANWEAKKGVLDQEEQMLRDLNDDIKNCTVRAGNDGLVIYHIPEQSRMGFGSQQSTIMEGETVRENQRLMRIPDLRQMRLTVKVHESEKPWVHRGQEAQVKVAALDRPLQGVVELVSGGPSAGDWSSSDVRLYPARIVLDEIVIMLEDRSVVIRKAPRTPEEEKELDKFLEESRAKLLLMPGMSCEVTIFVDEKDNVLRLPVHSVLEVAGEKFCYVKAGGDVERRVIETGLNNNRFVEVKDYREQNGTKVGLKAGEEVVANPRPLAEKRGDLSAKATIDAGETTRRTRGSGPVGSGPRPSLGPTPEGAPPAGRPEGGRSARGEGKRPEGGRPDGARPEGGRPEGGRGAGTGQFNPEDRQKMMEEWKKTFLNDYRSAKTDDDRKAVIENVPPFIPEDRRPQLIEERKKWIREAKLPLPK